MANPDDLTLFARVRANIERYARQTGDAMDITRLLMLAERGSMGEGQDTGPGWFVSKLGINQVTLPLRDAGDGDIEDANGQPVIQIDPNCERPDEKVTAIAEAVVLAINTCGGFHPRVAHESEPCAECGQAECRCDRTGLCGAPGCDNPTDRGICASCDEWVTEQVASMNAGSDAALILDSTNGGQTS